MTLTLGPGEYRIVPSEEMQEWIGRAKTLLSGEGLSEVLGDDDAFHAYTIEDATERPVLELVKKRVELEDGETGGSSGLLGGAFGYKDVFLFHPPGADPTFTLDIPRGLNVAYTFTDRARDEVLATWSKSHRFFGNWHLETPREGHVATVKGSRWLRELNPFRRQGTYVAHGVDGSDLGEFRHVGFGGRTLSDVPLSQLQIDLQPSRVSDEVVLAFAFGIYLEAKKGRHSHT